MLHGILVLALLFLVGCGGGALTGEPPQLDYTSAAYTRHSYTPYTTRSHSYIWNPMREVYIGGDLEPKESLRHVLTTDNGIRYYMGASRDGVGVDRLKSYETDLITRDGTTFALFSDDGFKPFLVQPRLYLDPDLFEPENQGTFHALLDSIFLLNDALPPEYQIAIMTDYTEITSEGAIG